MDDLRGARLLMDGWVFEPKELNAMLCAASLTTGLRRGTIVHAENQNEATALLRATLAGWVDFAFVPDPKTFCIYADHDEEITFFASTRGNLNRAVGPLTELGYEVVEGFVRQF
jgi:hypothetical protein